MPEAIVEAMNNSKPQLEIVGLSSDTNGRSCTLHSCCGDHVEHGDVLRIVKTVVAIDGVVEDALKCVKVVDGLDGCTVAFIPRVMAGRERIIRHINKFITVVELYDSSDNTYKKRRSFQNSGMASCAFLDEDEGRME